MAKYTSGRQKNLKVGISSYSENLTSLEVIGKVGIGTTNPQSVLDVRGTISIGATNVSGINSIFSATDTNSWEYSGVSLSVSGQDTSPNDIFFKSDGTKMFMVGAQDDEVNEYALSTPWNISTAGFTTVFSVATQETAPLGLYFSPDGLNMYVCGNTGVSPLVAGGDYVHQYALGTAWNISNTGGATVGYTTSYRVTSDDTGPQGVYLRNDGTKMFVVGSTNDRVYEYTLSTPWNVSSAGLTTSVLIGTGTTQNLPLTLTVPTGINFNASGTRMFIVDNSRDVVARFDLSTAWDINTAVFYDQVYIGFQDTSATGIFYQEDQSKAYLVGDTNNAIYQYNTNVPSLELASSGISTRSSIILNNETRLNNKLYVTGDTHFSSPVTLKSTLQVDSNITVSGGVINAGNVAATLLGGNTTTNITAAGGLTSGTLTVGGASQTGTTTIDPSTVSHTLNIAGGVSLASTSKTVNIATGGASGSNTLLTLGSATAGAISTVTIPSPTNLLIGSATTTGTASQPLQVTGGAYVSGSVGIGTTNPVGQLQVSTGPVIIGTATSTGTASQRLQIDGGAYIKNSVGIGTTNPTSALHVVGTVSATTFVGALTGTATSTTNIPNLTGDITSVNTSTTLATVNSNTGTFGSSTEIPSVTVNAKGLVTGITTSAITVGDGTLTLNTSGIGLTGSQTFTANQDGSSTFTVTSNATSNNTNSAIVSRNSSGGFSAGIITATQFSTGSETIGITTNTITGPAELIIDPETVNDNTGLVRIKGDLYVDGTQTFINSTTIELADFNVGIATTVGTNLLLDGAGIGIGSTGIRKTLTWSNSSTALKSSEDFDLASGKSYKIDGTSVLSSTTLGTGVLNSSLTSVGILGQLNVSGVVTASQGIQAIGIYSGSNLITTGIITAFNFIGVGNTFKVVENGVDISISGIHPWIKKISNYTADVGDQILADTTGGIFTITLPTSPSGGDSVKIADAGNWGIYSLNVSRNGSNIEGATEDFILDIRGIIVEFVYKDNTNGWQVYAYVGPGLNTGSGGSIDILESMLFV